MGSLAGLLTRWRPLRAHQFLQAPSAEVKIGQCRKRTRGAPLKSAIALVGEVFGFGRFALDQRFLAFLGWVLIDPTHVAVQKVWQWLFVVHVRSDHRAMGRPRLAVHDGAGVDLDTTRLQLVWCDLLAQRRGTSASLVLKNSSRRVGLRYCSKSIYASATTARVCYLMALKLTATRSIVWPFSAWPYDSAMAETINGLYEAEVIHRRSWSNRESVGLATLE